MPISISVIIPTYNRWPIVRRSIDSAMAQTTKPDEIIVIDDGSNDETVEGIRQNYSGKVSLLTQTNRGVSAARNAGLTHATGNWIALLDSDDEWLPEKLQHQIAQIEKHTNCVLCHTDEIWIRNGVRVNAMNKHKKSGGDIYDQCLPLCAISPSSALIHKDVFASVGNFNESLPACEDYDLWLRICSRHSVHYIDKPLLVKYGGHDDQLSHKYWGMDRFRVRALKNILDSNSLNTSQYQNTLNMLEKKTGILINGAVKHNNQPLIEECQTMLNHFNLTIPA